MNSFNIKSLSVTIGIIIGFIWLPEQVSAALSWNNTSPSFKTPETLLSADATPVCAQIHDEFPTTVREARSYNIAISGSGENPRITCLDCGAHASVTPGNLPGIGEYSTLTWNVQNEENLTGNIEYFKVSGEVGEEKIYGAICISVTTPAVYGGGGSLRWMGAIKKIPKDSTGTCEPTNTMAEVKVGEKKKIVFTTRLEGQIVEDTRTTVEFSCLNCREGATYTKVDNRTATIEWDTTNINLEQQNSWGFLISAKATRSAGGMGNVTEEIFGVTCVKVIGLCEKPDITSCKNTSGCVWLPVGRCVMTTDATVKCTEINDQAVCTSMLTCRFDEERKICLGKNQVEAAKAIDNFIAERYGMPKDYKGPLPPCAFTGSCRNVEDLVQLGVNIADWLFGIIAGLGFAFFVYGGLTMVLSFGNSEKVGQGKQILLAATVGMIIAFSAYVLVSFIVKAIGITP